MWQQAENEAAGSFFQYFQSAGTQLLHPLAGLPYFFFRAADKKLKTASQLKSFCVKTNLLFCTIRNSLNQSHSTMNLVPLTEGLVMLLPGWAPLRSRGFSLASRHMQSSKQPPAQTRGCPTFCRWLPLNHLHQTVWLYFLHCNTAVHNLSSAPRTLAKYSSCIIAFYCWLKSLGTNDFPLHPCKSHKHCTRQTVMHLEPPLPSAKTVLMRVVFLQTLSSSHLPKPFLLRRYMRNAVDTLLGTLLDLEDAAFLVGNPWQKARYFVVSWCFLLQNQQCWVQGDCCENTTPLKICNGRKGCLQGSLNHCHLQDK